MSAGQSRDSQAGSGGGRGGERVGGPASGLPASETPRRGYSWEPFSEGNDVAVRHGAYADVRLGPRVAELANELRPLVPGYRASDEVALRLLALCLSRLEAAEAAVAEASPADLVTLQQHMRGWTNSARRLLNDLAMTTTTRIRLGLDVARTPAALTVLDIAEDAAREARGGGEEG